MPTLLADAASKADLWTITAPTPANAMQVAYLKFNVKAGVLQLASRAELGSITTPWAPNVYKGTGAETRVTMTVNVPDAIREYMECIEERVRDLVRPYVPKIDAIWHSSSKPSDKHPSSLRGEIVWRSCMPMRRRRWEQCIVSHNVGRVVCDSCCKH